LDISYYKSLFAFTAKEIDAIRRFESKHAGCTELFSDLSGSPFEYVIIPTGLGIVKEVICGCGEKLILGDFLDLEESFVRSTAKLTEPQITSVIVETVKSIKSCPSMHFGNKQFASFWYWLSGIDFSVYRIFNSRTIWQEISDKMNLRLTKQYSTQRNGQLTPESIVSAEGSDAAAYSAWFSLFEEVMRGGFDDILKESSEEAET